ncbi:unnamed protein product, partial [Rotaria socialis]
MIKAFIVFSLLCFINARFTTNSTCKNCIGKIHSKQDLQLARHSLIIDKNQSCQNQRYTFFIIVKSGSFEKRSFTRSTWAKEISEHFKIPILYAIGYPKDPHFQKYIIAEDLKYHDLLQFNILEDYYNLTLKTTSVLLWYDRYCSKNSQFLLYVDDDVLIHVDKLIVYMHRTVNSDSIQGWFEKSVHIQREGMGGVSVDDFPIDFVPDYLWGAAVVYPSHIISNRLISAIFNSTVPIFFRDDVFINGFMAQQAGSEYLLYVDDDVLIHVDKLIIYMHRTVNNDSIQGWFENAVHIQREGMGGVSVDDFPIDFAPDYLWGATVVYPSHIISNRLISAIFNSTVPIFFRDDVFINGFMAQQAGIKREHMKGIFCFDPTQDDLNSKMILINFKNEEARENTWNCYKNGVRSNKKLPLFLCKVMCGMCLFIIIFGYCCKYFMETVDFDHLKLVCYQCFYKYHYPCKQNTNLMILMNGQQYSRNGIQQLFLTFQ